MESISPGHSTRNNIDVPHHHTPPTHHKPMKKETPTSQTNSPSIEIVDESVMKWTQDDIHHWFAQHDISSEIRDMYQFKTGGQMLTYAECLMNGWQKQYERYASRYAKQHTGKELLEHEFALFVSALKQLLSTCITVSRLATHKN